ncbi:MAG: transporter related protein [candidate division NC10 bacterium]|jgi:putative ABC transport system ATP-binding protein|nr:transporter related protein [candidate division NC10 bacterium]
MTLYEVRGVSYRYNLDRHGVQALCGVDLNVRKGEFMAISGPSGSGKTTLLNILGLLERPCEGTVRLDGAEVSGMSERERTRLRRERIGFIFQTFNLIPVLTAYENVEYFLLRRTMPGVEVRRRVLQALEAVGISAQADQRPNGMSGGQRQRVAIARALVRDADVILADEPTAALDQATGSAVMDLMRRLNHERGVTFVFSTHDPRILAAADRVVQLTDGRVIK